MLKAIGKSINIKVSSIKAAKIPVIILGNSPIKKSYEHKVDFLKTTGVVQGFWSLNPDIFNGKEYIEKTTGSGFLTIKNHYILQKCIKELLRNEMNYFSSMLPKSKLGEYIYDANKENSNEKKAEKFLKLIRSIQCKNTE